MESDLTGCHELTTNSRRVDSFRGPILTDAPRIAQNVFGHVEKLKRVHFGNVLPNWKRVQYGLFEVLS